MPRKPHGSTAGGGDDLRRGEMSKAERDSGLAWALQLFEQADHVRFPDIRVLVQRARGPQNLLDRFIREVDAHAGDRPAEHALPSIYRAWKTDASPATELRRTEARSALQARRSRLSAATRALQELLQENAAAEEKELLFGLAPLQVDMHFRSLAPTLHRFAAWLDRVPSDRADRKTDVARFVESTERELGFRPSWPCLADLWNLLTGDPDSPMTADRMRITAKRATTGEHSGGSKP